MEVAAKVEAHQATHTGDFGSYYYRYALTVIAADQVHVAAIRTTKQCAKRTSRSDALAARLLV